MNPPDIENQWTSGGADQMPTDEPIIEIRNLDKFFGEFQALSDVNLTVHSG